MSDKLYEYLMKLPRKNLIALLYEALDSMQAYNGRSRTQCICMALGFKEEKVKNDGNLRWRYIPLAEVKRNTDSMGL